MQSTQTPAPDAIVKYMGGNVVFYWFLSLLTGGLYFYFFQSKFNSLSRKLNMEIDGRRLQLYFILSLLLRIVGIGLPLVSLFMGEIDDSGLPEITVTSSLLITAAPFLIFFGSILELMWCYRARYCLRMYVFMHHRVTLDINRFLLFFFPGFVLTMAFSRIEGEVLVAQSSTPRSNV